MKKAFFTLAVLVMAFGNVGLAQIKTNLKSNEKANVLKHYGIRGEINKVPQTAIWHELSGDTYRNTYTYDEYDYYLSEEFMEMKSGENWLPYSWVTYDYDIFSGRVLGVLSKINDGGAWENETMETYTYEDDELIEIMYQNWDGDDWENDMKELYTYNGDVTAVLIRTWNGTTWVATDLHTYTYSGNTIELVMQYMQGGAWQNMERCTYTLDFDENITEILVELWANNAWEFNQKNVYHFNGGVYTSMTVEVDNGLVVNQFDYIYVDGDATHGESKTWTGGSQLVSGDGEMEMSYGYNAACNYYYGTEVTVTYFDVTGLKENAQTANFKVYPVPAENEILIQAESFQKAEIYSVTGQKLMESLQNRMDVNALSAGLYVIKVYDLEGSCETQRLVVR